MSMLDRRQILKGFLATLATAAGTTVLAESLLTSETTEVKAANDSSEPTLAERADAVAASECDGQPDGAVEVAAFVNGGFRNAGFRNAGFRNAGFRNAGFVNGGFRNAGFRNGGFVNGGFRNGGFRNF